MAQKTTPAALALSARNTELAKKNVHHHRLGPGGYRGKQVVFRKMEEEAAESRAYNLKWVSRHASNWILGRSLEGSSALKFDNPEIEQAVSKILKSLLEAGSLPSACCTRQR